MTRVAFPRLVWAALAVAALLLGIFTTLVLRFRRELRDDVRQRMIERDAAVLSPVAQQQIENALVESRGANVRGALSVLLRYAQQEGMLAMSIFNSDGATLESIPAAQPFVELPLDDYFLLSTHGPISRLHEDFPLDRLFLNVAEANRRSPVLEIVLPLRRRSDHEMIGFVRYYLDARLLARELALIDDRLRFNTVATLAIGSSLIVVVIAGAYIGLRRTQRAIAERNERLARANFELTLAAKASAVGQITSHLIHGLQGPIAGLRAAVAAGSAADWESAAVYTERLQTMIRDTVDLLGDTRAQVSYELSGEELAEAIRRRGQARVLERNGSLEVEVDVSEKLDSHRGSLLCLIASNLVENAADATGSGGRVRVSLRDDPTHWQVRVADDGPGIPPEMRDHLFEPGKTSKATGSGLGLAISHLLARQLNGELRLSETGPRGTTFELIFPKQSDSEPQ